MGCYSRTSSQELALTHGKACAPESVPAHFQSRIWVALARPRPRALHAAAQAVVNQPRACCARCSSSRATCRSHDLADGVGLGNAVRRRLRSVEQHATTITALLVTYFTLNTVRASTGLLQLLRKPMPCSPSASANSSQVLQSCAPVNLRGTAAAWVSTSPSEHVQHWKHTTP